MSKNLIKDALEKLMLKFPDIEGVNLEDYTDDEDKDKVEMKEANVVIPISFTEIGEPVKKMDGENISNGTYTLDNGDTIVVEDGMLKEHNVLEKEEEEETEEATETNVVVETEKDDKEKEVKMTTEVIDNQEVKEEVVSKEELIKLTSEYEKIFETQKKKYEKVIEALKLSDDDKGVKNKPSNEDDYNDNIIELNKVSLMKLQRELGIR
ncbi:MAG: hypothetical protein ACOC1K_00910 [Nanoarchaeota archaeon]